MKIRTVLPDPDPLPPGEGTAFECPFNFRNFRLTPDSRAIAVEINWIL